MGDFERTFGAGANAVNIIDGFSRNYYARTAAKANCVFFSSLEDALVFAKRFPGNTLRPSSTGKRFILEFDAQNFSMDFSLLADCPERNGRGNSEVLFQAHESTDVLRKIASKLLGECTRVTIQAPPLSLNHMVEEIKKMRLRFFPFSEKLCIIESDDEEGSLEAVIITEKGASTIIYRNSQTRIYNALMGVNSSGEQIR